MFLEDLPTESLNELIELFTQVKNNDETPKPTQVDLFSEIDQISKDTLDTLKIQLMKSAHLLDSQVNFISELKTEIESMKADFSNSTSVRNCPTPFILRIYKKVQLSSEDFSEKISSLETKLYSSSHQKSNFSYYTTLSSEHKALKRLATRAAKLNENSQKRFPDFFKYLEIKPI